MRSLRIQIDEPTFRALYRVASEAQRAELVRAAIRKAIREAEEERMRRAYLAQPDSGAEADDWSLAEEWKTRTV
jgi:hypothetical protein